MSDPFSAVMPVARRPDTVFVSGRGSWLTDRRGHRYLDFVQGWAVNALGHSHPAILHALRTQAEHLINPGPAFYNEAMVALASRLADLSGIDQVFFANSGAEANEGAIKLARKWGAVHRPGAHKIITFANGFHGRTLATMAASGKPGWESLFRPLVPGFVKVPYNDLAAVERAIDPHTVAVMLEPVQGEAGVIPATRAFLSGLRRLTQDAGLLLICDEVQTGMGRTGALFASQDYGVQPDIMTLGKGIGGGVPLSALLASRSASCFEPGDQGGTFNGNPLMCAAGLAVLETLTRPGFLEAVRDRGRYLRQGLADLAVAHDLGAVRGRGLLLALDTGTRDAAAIAAAAFRHRVLVNAPRSNTLRFMPALTVSRGEIDIFVRRLGAALDAPEIRGPGHGGPERDGTG